MILPSIAQLHVEQPGFEPGSQPQRPAVNHCTTRLSSVASLKGHKWVLLKYLLALRTQRAAGLRSNESSFSERRGLLSLRVPSARPHRWQRTSAAVLGRWHGNTAPGNAIC